MKILKISLATTANIATLFACLLLAVATAPTLKSLWLGTPQSAAGAPPIERVSDDIRTPLPTASVKGDAHARVALIEFSDFQCPFCGNYARDLFPKVQKEYIDTGTVLYGYRHFPLNMIHPLAQNAAKAARCAAEQDKFWLMHDVLFRHQNALAAADLVGYAEQMVSNQARFAACLEADASNPDDDVQEGKRLGVTSTPTFLVGTVQPNGEVRVMTRIRGAQGLDVFSGPIREALQRASHSP